MSALIEALLEQISKSRKRVSEYFTGETLKKIDKIIEYGPLALILLYGLGFRYVKHETYPPYAGLPSQRLKKPVESIKVTDTLNYEEIIPSVSEFPGGRTILYLIYNVYKMYTEYSIRLLDNVLPRTIPKTDILLSETSIISELLSPAIAVRYPVIYEDIATVLDILEAFELTRKIASLEEPLTLSEELTYKVATLEVAKPVYMYPEVTAEYVSVSDVYSVGTFEYIKKQFEETISLLEELDKLIAYLTKKTVEYSVSVSDVISSVFGTVSPLSFIDTVEALDEYSVSITSPTVEQIFLEEVIRVLEATGTMQPYPEDPTKIFDQRKIQEKIILTDLILAEITPAVPPNWLVGWSYRRSHEILGTTIDLTDYQIKIKTIYKDEVPENIVPYSEIVSDFPIPSGTVIISGQAAAYYDGENLHVWFGASSDGTSLGDAIYYTKTSDFMNWTTPVKVIERTGEGIRDPTIFVEGDYIYLFCQCWDGANFRPIRLYKINKNADFTNPANYIYVGVVIDVGASGEFDDKWVASPCVVKIGDTYYLMYEAYKSDGTYSIGRAKSTSIESLPWTKDGQLKDPAGNVIRNPVSPDKAIVPCTFTDENTLFIHYFDGSTWHIRYIKGDFANNSVVLSDYDVDPDDGYTRHTNFTHVGFINGVYYFLMVGAKNGAMIHLYRKPRDVVFLAGKCKPDFSDIRFTADDGVTKLSYWLQEKVDEDYAIFWVKVPSIPASPGKALIYVYYGNPDAVSESDGEATFEFFDDFDDGVIDSSKWDLSAIGSLSADETDSYLRIYGTRSVTEWNIIRSISKLPRNTAIHYKCMIYSESGNLLWRMVGGFDDPDVNQETYGGYMKPDSEWRLNVYDGTTVHKESLPGAYELNKWYELVLKLLEESAVFITPDGNIAVLKAYPSQGKIRIGCSGYAGSSEETRFDYVFVRKYVAPEPSHGTWGAEETA